MNPTDLPVLRPAPNDERTCTLFRTINGGAEHEPHGTPFKETFTSLHASLLKPKQGGKLDQALVFSSLRGNRAKKDNVLEASWLVYDFDGAEPAAFEATLAMLPRHIVYVTHSGLSGTKPGVRARLILDTSRPMKPDEYEIAWSQFAALYGLTAPVLHLDTGKHGPENLFYITCPVGKAAEFAASVDRLSDLSRHVVDVDDLLRSAPPATALATATATARGMTFDYPDPKASILRGESWAECGNRVPTFLSAVCAIARDMRPLTPAQLRRLTAPSVEAINARDVHDPFKHAESCITSAVKYANEGASPEAPDPPKAVLAAPTNPLIAARRRAGEIFAPRQPVPWLVEALVLAPGRPTVIYSAPGIGKTLAMLALAIAVATGRPVWEVFNCRKGRVVWIDFENGEDMMSRRIAQLADGMGVGEADLANLELVSLPETFLNRPDFERNLAEICQGAVLCVVDTLREAIPGEDENDSSVGHYLAKLTRVSELVGGLTSIVLHHSKKGEDGGMRGSDAIRGAANNVYALTQHEEGPRRLSHEKSNLAEKRQPILLAFDHAPFRVREITVAPRDEEAERRRAIVKVFEDCYPYEAASKSAVVNLCGGRRQDFLRTFACLETEGAIYREGQRYRLSPPRPRGGVTRAEPVPNYAPVSK